MYKVSVIVTAHNYAKYLPQAIGSVLNQTYENYQIIIVDDGSTDNTDEVLKEYEHLEMVEIVSLPGVGLAKAANIGIKASCGEYVIRLDADDYFDENILLVLSSILDRSQELGMVYPDYYQVNKHGEIIDQVRQLKINDEVKLLDRSALAAGAMYRRSCFDEIGGYNEELSYQEDYDFWIRFIDRYHVYNVQLPLMYYRKHSLSMSTNQAERVKSRQYVKRKFAKHERSRNDKDVLCVLPMVATNRYKHKLALTQLDGKPLLSYILRTVQSTPIVNRIIVDTDDHEIAEVAKSYGAEVPFLRPQALSKLDVRPVEILKYLLKKMNYEQHYIPDIILMAFYNYPFIRPEHLEEAVNTLLIYKCDSVISVVKDCKFHWCRGKIGLEPLSFPRKLLSDEKRDYFEEKGGIYALNTNNMKTDSFLGKSISCIEIGEEESVKIDSDHCLWIAEEMCKRNCKSNEKIE